MAAKKGAAPVGDAAVEAKTGRDWQGWLEVLDAAGGADMTHADIARLLTTRYRLPAWWSQMVTVGYERLRNRRQPLQTSRGFSANASRTMAVRLKQVFAVASQADFHSRWLPPDVIVHRATAGKSMRATDAQGRKSISLGFYDKGEGRTQVTAQQDQLRSRAEALRLKKSWASSLAALESLAGPPPLAERPTASRTRARRPLRRK